MATRKNKETNIEKLEALKCKLKTKIKAQEQVLDQNLSYFCQNVGSLAAGSVLHSVKKTLPSGLRAVVAPLLALAKDGSCRQEKQTTTSKRTQWMNEILPVVVEIALPLALQVGMSFLKKKILKNK